MQNQRQGGRICPVARTRQQHFLHVALRERALSGRDLYDRGLVLGPSGRSDGQGDGERRQQREHHEDRADRASTARGEGLDREPAFGPQETTSSVCMPPRKWPDMLQNNS